AAPLSVVFTFALICFTISSIFNTRRPPDRDRRRQRCNARVAVQLPAFASRNKVPLSATRDSSSLGCQRFP
ncbi:hypothetical protein SB725_34135, partial [Pseudomonas sp. SIMBA_041]|uniref:hypothetical protein n=1 Tax=Pseudomonas sp. SIMBA_041 TaxID=3085782 RepID=UPI00397B7331